MNTRLLIPLVFLFLFLFTSCKNKKPTSFYTCTCTEGGSHSQWAMNSKYYSYEFASESCGKDTTNGTCVFGINEQ